MMTLAASIANSMALANSKDRDLLAVALQGNMVHEQVGARVYRKSARSFYAVRLVDARPSYTIERSLEIAILALV